VTSLGGHELRVDDWRADRAYHHTAPVNMTCALREALRAVLEEGLLARIARHRRNHLALRAGVEAMGGSRMSPKRAWPR
jgi:alanine-glyoxylate transaminase/serine-glyoxylate transaminase/serine-pyruvate transaminase